MKFEKPPKKATGKYLVAECEALIELNEMIISDYLNLDNVFVEGIRLQNKKLQEKINKTNNRISN
jgi:hypothetical protein